VDAAPAARARREGWTACGGPEVDRLRRGNVDGTLAGTGAHEMGDRW